MAKSDNQFFMLWGGYLFASLLIECIGFYFSTVFGIVLLGVCVAGAMMLAMGKKVLWLEEVESKHQGIAKIFTAVGKIDVLSSIIVLPLIVRAFAISMGWLVEDGRLGYALFAAYLIYFLWGMAIVFGIGSYFVSRLKQNKK